MNVANTYGRGTQAIALSEYGSRAGFYACSFTGYQDTLLANEGTSVYLDSYIQGATDFIFGRRGRAFFGGNTIAVSGPGWITASGRESNDNGICKFSLSNSLQLRVALQTFLKELTWHVHADVFDGNRVVLASGASSDTSGRQYFGRPWGGPSSFQSCL